MTKYTINVPQAAKIMGKNQVWLRKKIQDDAFRWGTCDTMESGYPVFYIFPKLFIEDTGATQRQLEEITGKDWTEFYNSNFGLKTV